MKHLIGPVGVAEVFLENDMQCEQYESACDFAIHVFYHACTLCQDGRELHRGLLYPKYDAWPSAGLHEFRQGDPSDGLHEYRQGWIKFQSKGGRVIPLWQDDGPNPVMQFVYKGPRG